MPIVTVYTTRICWYCDQAKRLLTQRSIAFQEVDVSEDARARVWLVETTGQRTVPQIFIGDQPIGGYTDLAALDRSGRLNVLLNPEETP
jgi:glutaredoxin 3